MVTFTRRQVLQGAGALALIAALPRVLRASEPRIRYSVDSTEGAAMVEKYARAVATMRDEVATPIGSPRSWKYQWYIHSTPNLDKQAELTRAYGSLPSNPARTLASEIWETCQGHHPGSDVMSFLPWHRMYLLCFEDIVRAVLQDPEFTLPYWDYTLQGSQALPRQFREGPLSSLFMANRRTVQAKINDGDPMDKGLTVSPFNLSAMKIAEYGGQFGFCRTLDRLLHGAVHVRVGDESNMGYVPTAAGDPIFWLHHCMIDRIWAGWNASGGVNQSTSAKFAFADAMGRKREFDVALVGDISALEYRYDSLPALPTGTIQAAAAAHPPVQLATSAPTETELARDVTRIPLKLTLPNHPIGGAVAALPPRGKLVVTIESMRTDVQPGTLYEMFVDLPPNADLATKQKHYVGTFNFFGLDAHGHDPGGVSFDATDALRATAPGVRAGEDSVITIIPVDPPSADAKPRVGAIRLSRQ